jgi:hypothetical protein
MEKRWENPSNRRLIILSQNILDVISALVAVVAIRRNVFRSKSVENIAGFPTSGAYHGIYVG